MNYVEMAPFLRTGTAVATCGNLVTPPAQTSQLVLKQMSYNASLSSKKDSSEFSTSWWKLRTALYGSTTVSDTLGDGITENVSMIRSGYLQMTAAETASAILDAARFTSLLLLRIAPGVCYAPA